MELHPIHVAYLSRNGSGELDTLFKLFDALGNMKLLTEALSLTYFKVIEPEVSEPTSVHDRMGDLIQEPVSHRRFKEKSLELAGHGGESVLVAGIVHHALSYILCRANANIEECLSFHKGLIGSMRRKLAGELASWERAQMEELVQISEKTIKTFPQVVKDFQAFYAKFCEVVLGGLLQAELDQSALAEKEMRRIARRKLSEEEFPGAPRENPAE